MTLEAIQSLFNAWSKEVSHTDFRYLSPMDALEITSALDENLTKQWKNGIGKALRCPSCNKDGFLSIDVWSAVAEKARLKCKKCGEWSSVKQWDQQTRGAR